MAAEAEEEVRLEVEAVYGDDHRVVRAFPPHLVVHVRPRTADDSSQQFVELFLGIKASSQYPKEPPHVYAVESKGLDENRQAYLITSIQNKAKELSYYPMLVTLCEEAGEILSNMNHPAGDCPLCLYPLVSEDKICVSNLFSPVEQVDIKLDGQNYHEWSSSVRMLLRSISLLSYIMAEPPTEKTDVKEATTWRSADDRVMGILCHSANISIRMDFIDLPSSRKMWEYLQHRYEQTSAARLFFLLQTLHDLRQQEMSIKEYYSSFTRISRQLTSMVPLSYTGCIGCVGKAGHNAQNLMFTFVMRLRLEFESIRAQMPKASKTCVACWNVSREPVATWP